LKSLMVIVESDRGEGAAAVSLPPPPHPASAATVRAIETRLNI
jgi:hypothetical protein